MSAVHITVLACDVAGCPSTFTINGGLRAATFAETRAAAQEIGWLIQPRELDGDRCPSHQAVKAA